MRGLLYHITVYIVVFLATYDIIIYFGSFIFFGYEFFFLLDDRGTGFQVGSATDTDHCVGLEIGITIGAFACRAGRYVDTDLVQQIVY